MLLSRFVVGVERLQRALQVIGASLAVKNGMGSLSCNLIAPSGSGKSQLILSRLPYGARVENDVTYMTLMHLMKLPNPPKYLVIPDLNMVISHKPAVAELTMAMLLALTGEGVSELNPGLQNEVRVRMDKAKRTGLRIALITGITPQMFAGKRGKWRQTGLLRRLVPINYTYTKRTQRKIQDDIAAGVDGLSYGHAKPARMKPRDVEIPPGQIQVFIRELSEQVLEQLTWKAKDSAGHARGTVRAIEYPFDPHKTLRQVARSAAALQDRDIVTVDDLADVENIAAFMRYDRPEEL
jgi:hypothetical protein